MWYVTTWNMRSRCSGAAISSIAAGAEKWGCGCLLQDGGIPAGFFFCLFVGLLVLFFFFSSFCLILAWHSCWENIFTHVWVSRCSQVFTATKNPLKACLPLLPTLSVQETSLPIEQEGKTKGERVTSWPTPVIPPAEAGRPSSRPLRAPRIRPTWEVPEPLSFSFVFFLTVKKLFFRYYVRRPICLSLLTDFKRITGRKHSTQFLNLSCTIAWRCHKCLNRNLVFPLLFKKGEKKKN